MVAVIDQATIGAMSLEGFKQVIQHSGSMEKPCIACRKLTRKQKGELMSQYMTLITL